MEALDIPCEGWALRRQVSAGTSYWLWWHWGAAYHLAAQQTLCTTNTLFQVAELGTSLTTSKSC